MKNNYNDKDLKSILEYSKKLEGKTFKNILEDYFEDSELELNERIEIYNGSSSKGKLGNLIEEYYFEYKPNSDSRPDFEHVGLELKLTPYEETKKLFKAGERLVITMIPNTELDEKEFEFEGSHLETKLKLILMIWYNRSKNQEKINHRIDYVVLYDLYSKVLKKDLEIIKEDYEYIINKIRLGEAHTLSEGDTKYLGACTKGATAKRSLQPQYYNKEIPAKRRAFSLKQSYMTYILNDYVKSGKMNYDSILDNENLKDISFETLVLSKIKQYIGSTENYLYNLFGVKSHVKQKNRIIVNRILGINTDNSEEFEKANIEIKTIRVQKNGKPKESMSFPKIVIKEFIKQEFEDSYEYNYFESTKFLFVVFKEDENGEYYLKGCKFWNMPSMDLDNKFKEEWGKYKNSFLKGINFEIKHNVNGVVVKNDLPKKKDNDIIHLRPHSSKSAYLIEGIKYGNGDESDMDVLVNGDKMTHQSFWLNNDYVAKIISDI